MSLPSPTFGFTIPSIHDDTILRCRIYLPPSWALVEGGTERLTKAAIVAHPYALLGGCFDDPIVEGISHMLLNAGYIIGTFNFRGASGSAGHTSWSARPELGDYVSFYGFMLHYLHCVMSGPMFHSPTDQGEPVMMPSVQEAGSFTPALVQVPRLILAGYSYGALIASSLPEASRVRSIFAQGSEASAVSEIVLRASNLALQTWRHIENQCSPSTDCSKLEFPRPSLCLSSTTSSSPMIVGGFESNLVELRISRDSRRSAEMRKSLDRVREKIHPQPQRQQQPSVVQPEITSELDEAQICYLLVSPVLPPTAAFATFFSTLSFARCPHEESSTSRTTNTALAICPSLAVYGTKDFFTSAKRLRNWANRLGQIPGSNFQQREVTGAGHFWREPRVLELMKQYIAAWEHSLDAFQ